MANILYESAKEGFLDGTIDWDTDNVVALLIDVADYTLDPAADRFLSDIPAAARVAASANLTNKTAALGVADADDVTWPSVTGDQSEAIVLYQNTGVDATSRLIAYIDTATGLPVTPNGGDIQVVWDSGLNRIFSL